MDDFLFDVIPPSLRIAPLHDPFPTLISSSARPSPLEPNAHITTDNDANKLTGRRKALAQAKALDAPEPEEWDPRSTSAMNDADCAEEDSRKKQKRESRDAEQTSEFVQLPRPSAKINLGKPRPFPPLSILNELHEPPPSVALFPPITPNATQGGEEGLLSRPDSPRANIDRCQGHSRSRKSNERPKSPSTTTRTYNRGRTKWSQDEIDNLIKGVTIYGTGRWKNVLEHPNLHFKEGRTPTDLKDRFRVCFPPNVKGKHVKPITKKTETENGIWDILFSPNIILLTPVADAEEPLQSAPKDPPQTKDRPAQRARKRHWTEAEDAELEKGFLRHGYNWNAMVKDPGLHFDGRSGGQIRDRFRLKFKSLYEGQDANYPPSKATRKAESHRREQIEQTPTLTKKTSDASTPMEDDENEVGGNGKTVLKTPFSTGIFGVEDEDNRLSLSNSILHNELELDENLTLAPLTWEDMAIRPIFNFD